MQKYIKETKEEKEKRAFVALQKLEKKENKQKARVTWLIYKRFSLKKYSVASATITVTKGYLRRSKSISVGKYSHLRRTDLRK